MEYTDLRARSRCSLGIFNKSAILALSQLQEIGSIYVQSSLPRAELVWNGHFILILICVDDIHSREGLGVEFMTYVGALYLYTGAYIDTIQYIGNMKTQLSH